MTTIPKVYHVRETVGTAAAGFVTDLYSPREAIKEGVANAFSWLWLALKSGQLQNLDKPVRINLHQGPTHNDLQIIDDGLGWESINRVRRSGIIAATEEEAKIIEERRADPNYIGKFGVGINGLLSLSSTGEIEIKSVSIDKYGRTSGFICDLVFMSDALGNKVPHYSDPENIDSKFIMSHPGCCITIKNLKKGLTKTSIINYLSKVFYRKIYEGYKIWIADYETDNLHNGKIRYTVVPPKEGACCNCETQIGVLSNGYPVFAELHRLKDRNASPDIDFLIKKVGGICSLALDRMAKGYVWTAGILPKMGRDNVRDDEDSPFTELLDMVDAYCESKGFPKKSENHTNDLLRNAKKLRELSSAVLTKFYRTHPELVPPALRSHFKQNDIEGQKAEKTKGWDDKKSEQKEQREKETEKENHDPKRKYKKHRKHRRRPILSEGDKVVIDMGVDKKSVPNSEICWIDPEKCMFMVNSAMPDSNLYQMMFGQGVFSEDLYLTYNLMAVINLGYRDTNLTAGELLCEMGKFFSEGN